MDVTPTKTVLHEMPNPLKPENDDRRCQEETPTLETSKSWITSPSKSVVRKIQKTSTNNEKHRREERKPSSKSADRHERRSSEKKSLEQKASTSEKHRREERKYSRIVDRHDKKLSASEGLDRNNRKPSSGAKRRLVERSYSRGGDRHDRKSPASENLDQEVPTAKKHRREERKSSSIETHRHRETSESPDDRISISLAWNLDFPSPPQSDRSFSSEFLSTPQPGSVVPKYLCLEDLKLSGFNVDSDDDKPEVGETSGNESTPKASRHLGLPPSVKTTVSPPKKKSKENEEGKFS